MPNPWQEAVVPDPIFWPDDCVPTNGGGTGNPNCAICPAIFTVNVCAGNTVPMFLCQGNQYRISMCTSGTVWNSTLTVTNGALNTAFASDDDGCGTPDGHADLLFSPSVSQVYRIRIFQDPCVVNATACGILVIECLPPPPPPPFDDPCGAFPLPVNPNCVYFDYSNASTTPTTPPPSPPCGSYGGNDVWFTAVVPADGNLGISVAAQTNMAAAAYTAPNCSNGFGLIQCNADETGSSNFPRLVMSALTPGSTVYIRVWPENGSSNAGPFSICAYELNPPVNDNPCGAIAIPVTAGCTYGTYNTVDATPLTPTMTLSPANPTCGTPVAGGDVWFTVTIPASGAVRINTLQGTIGDMAMALYTLTGSACGGGTLTQVGCNDNVTTIMPSFDISGTPGQVFYVRLWHRYPDQGSFQICATPIVVPANDNPCGAFLLTAQYGCQFTSQTNVNATLSTQANSNVTIPPLSCGGIAYADVWFRVVVPPNGILVFETEPGTLTDAAMAVYAVASGSCATNNLVLDEVACTTTGSPFGPNMPSLSAGGLVPGSTVYIRIWRFGATTGTFGLCVRRTNPPPGNCYYLLRMYDTMQNGWNGSTVTICINGVCTPYTINGAYGEVIFAANYGATITAQYTGAGSFQSEQSWTVSTSNGATLYASTFLPTVGVVWNITVTNSCNWPPSPPGDCTGAASFCQEPILAATPVNTGNVEDLNATNDGCMDEERMGMWFTFTVQDAGKLAFSITPNTPTFTDFDFAIWGPNTGLICPPVGPPIRCSFAPPDIPYVSGVTGLDLNALDTEEDLVGDGWVQYIDGLPGETYMLYIDNFGMNGSSFNLVWDPLNTGTVGCLFLPVELASFEAVAGEHHVDLLWSTASEQNSAYFEVQRSADLESFTPLGRVDAAGSSVQLTDYSFVDDQPLQGINYYRLKQVDTDGAVHWSHTVFAVFNGPLDGITVFPNPADDVLNMTFLRPTEGLVRWRLRDASGRLFAEGRYTAHTGLNRLPLSLAGLGAGLYVVELTDDAQNPLGMARFIKQ